MNKIYVIQYLRGLAALAVVYHHADIGSRYRSEFAQSGVDVFFVISGFIMWVVTVAEPKRPAQFLRDRIIRIAPLYWFCTLAMVVAAILQPKLFPRLVLDSWHTIASLFFLPTRSPSNGEMWPVLVQGWSLNYEMFFYLVFAIALNFDVKHRLAIVCGVLVSLALLGMSIHTQNPIILTYTDPMLLEFLGGVVLGVLWERTLLPRPLVGGLMVALGMICIVSIVPAIDAPRVVAWGGPALLIVGGVLSLSAFVPRFGVPTALGDASYSIYLTHTFVVSALAKVMPAGSSLIFTALLGSSAVGLFVHWLLERPVQRMMTRRSARLRSKPISGQTHVSVEPFREAQVGQDVR